MKRLKSGGYNVDPCGTPMAHDTEVSVTSPAVVSNW